MADPIVNNPMSDSPDSNYLFQVKERDDRATFQHALNEMAQSQGGGGASGAKPAKPAGPEQSTMGKIGEVAANTAYGAVAEVVPQLIAGRFDAVRHAGMAVKDVGDWLDTNAPWLSGMTAAEMAKRKETEAARTAADAASPGFKLPLKTFSTEDMFGFGAEPTTGIGLLARKYSELMTGFGWTNAPLQAAGLSKFIASPAAAGLAGFLAQDPKELGLGNLLEKIPALGPIFNELAVNPDDPPLLNRAKHMVDGIVGTAAADGVLKVLKMGAKWVHSRPAAQAAAQASPAEIRAAESAAREAEYVAQGTAFDAAKPNFTISIGDKAAAKLAEMEAAVGPSVPGQVTAKPITASLKLDPKTAKYSDIGVNVNWENIDLGNLRGLIGEVGTELKNMGVLDRARRGVITLDAQKDMAGRLGMTADDMLARGVGQAYNAEEMIAAGQIFLNSEKRMYALAHLAEMPASTPAEAFLLNKQVTTHLAMLEQFLGAQAEAGRALGAMRMVHKMGTMERAQYINEYLNMAGGKDGAQRLSSMLIDLETAGVSSAGLTKALSRGVGRWTWDAVKEGFSMGLLTKPVSHVRNVIGNVAMMVQHSSDIKVAEKISAFMGEGIDPKNLVQNGEAMANLQGALASWRTGLEFAGKYVRTGNMPDKFARSTTPVEDALGASGRAGMPGMGSNVGAGGTLYGGQEAAGAALVRAPPISAQSVGMDLMGKSYVEAQAFAQTPFGKALDWIGAGVRLPGRLLGGPDMYFKEMGFAGHMEQNAYRQALVDGATPGTREFVDKVANYISNPPKNVELASVKTGDYVTFQNALGPWGQTLLNTRSGFQPLFIALPYAKTPSNIFSVMMEHTPMAPIVKAWREDFAAGGGRQAMAEAKIVTGFMMTSMLFDWARNGHLTGAGPKEPSAREALLGSGWQPNSVKIGKYYFGISGMAQLAGPLAFAAAVHETMERYDVHPQAFDTFRQSIGIAGAVMAHSTIDQSMLQGLSKASQAIGASGRGEDTAWGNYYADLFGNLTSAVPGVGALRSAGALYDPSQRQAGPMWQDLIKGIIGVQSTLINNRDAFGHVVQSKPEGFAGNLYNWIIPFKVSWDNDHPAFNEMARLKMGITKPGWSTEFMGVPMNFRKYPEVLDYWRRLAGNELKKNPETGQKIGLEDFLNAVVTGDRKAGYSAVEYKGLPDLGEDYGTDSGKGTFIKQWAAKYRHWAAEQIMKEAPERFPEFYAEVTKAMEHQAVQRTPTNMQQIAPKMLKMKLDTMPMHQDPLPDRFGKMPPSAGPRRAPASGGTFSVPGG